MIKGLQVVFAVFLLFSTAVASLVSEHYVVVTDSATLDDPQWSEVVDSLSLKYAADVLIFNSSVWEVSAYLADEDPHRVCFVLKPERIIAYDSESLTVDISQLLRHIDDDPYGDALWAILTGYTAEDAMNIVRGPDTLWVRNALLKTAGGYLTYFESGDYFAEGDVRRYWHKNPDGSIDTLPEPEDCTDTLVSLLNSNTVDIMVTSGHASSTNWQLHYPDADGEGFFFSSFGGIYATSAAGETRAVNTDNPKIYWGPGNCLIGNVENMNCMVLAWIHSGGARLFCGYTVPTWYGYMGWGLKYYFVFLEDRFTFPEAFFWSNQALLSAQIHSIPGTNPDGLAYDRDVVALYGDPGIEARIYPTVPPLYDQGLECDTIGDDTFHFIFWVRMNRNVDRYDRPAFAVLPFEIDPASVSVDSGNVHLYDIVNDFVGMYFWQEGDSALEEGDYYYLAFTCSGASHVKRYKDISSFYLNVMPNPFNSIVEIEYNLNRSGEISVYITDLLGDKIAVLVHSYQHAGTHKVIWTPGTDVPSGIYFVNLIANGVRRVHRVFFVR